MYTVSLFDIVMAWVGVALLVAFTGTLVHSVMKVKVRAVAALHWESWHQVYSAYMDASCELASLQADLPKQILKAKREHGKKVRKSADRKLERTEREYEAHIQEWQKMHDAGVAARDNLARNIATARGELSAFQSIVDQELHNFIRLPSVRNACKKAINTNHKAWQEL